MTSRHQLGPKPSECRCMACIGLVAAYGGWRAADRFGPKLWIRGWSGRRHQSEQAWLHRHAPTWWASLRQNRFSGGFSSAPEGENSENDLGVINKE